MRSLKDDIIEFWFEETPPNLWFQSTAELDQSIKERFESAYESAINDKYKDWESDADGVLALCILLDQFPRMIFRDTPKAFASDAKALVIAKRALHLGLDQILAPIKRRFVYLPFMHSEHLMDQKKSVELFEAMQNDDPLGFKHAKEHCDVIDRFDRFPGRNKALGRENTPDEIAFLTAKAA